MEVGVVELLPEGSMLGTGKGWRNQRGMAVGHMAEMTMCALVLLAVNPYKFKTVSIPVCRQNRNLYEPTLPEIHQCIGAPCNAICTNECTLLYQDLDE
jgi:hypothetical protein